MKYLAALLVVLGTAGSAQAASLLRCAIWIVPDRTCSLEERVIGGAILTAGVGAIIGSAGAATGLITFSASIATTAVAGALIGGATGTVGALIVR